MKYKGYTIRAARSTGGKAGKGRNKTSTVQVLKDDMLVKAVRFKVDSAESWTKARTKAKAWIDAAAA
jgi:hypothetical protein